MSAAELDDGRVEWRVAPRSEPLASCAFEWPAGWAPVAPDWVPPGLGARVLLCGLRGAGALDVWVLRFGAEVDGLAALTATLDTPLIDARWAGLPLVEAHQADGSRWAVVHAGPALFALRATGDARRHLPRAARTLRSLTERPPVAERLTALRIGPLRTRRLAAWRAPDPPATPHGHHRAVLLLEDPKAIVMARIEVLLVDCRVFVGFDPRVALRAADGRLGVLGVEPDPSPGDAPLGDPDPGPSGPARIRRRSMRAADAAAEVEHRRAVRRIGPALIVVDGLWRPEARVARLNGRRHQDILLALGACP